ncbi:S41 family peptidase [Microlunatus ginsengisoli]|uniref:Tail specific protease domain-containing protein n=1 Tax=Microlunatus ginsengisoli TaxID=363863 RepID=A0ABP6ZSR6_9ACTN
MCDSAPTRLDALASLLVDQVTRHYGSDARTEALGMALSGFDRSERPADAAGVREVELAAQTVFRHLELVYQPGLEPQDHSPGWPEPDLAMIRRRGADVAEVRRDPDGTATIRLTGLAPVEAAAPLLRGAFTLVRDAEAIILDLRDNTGGDPATVAVIIDWLAGDGPRHLFDVVYRDRVRQWWTAGSPIADRPDGPVRALIGPRTYSSGEALAWALQDQRLATLAGQPTRGAADHVVPLALTHDVRALIPEARVAAPDGGPTWEGCGVQPDEPG